VPPGNATGGIGNATGGITSGCVIGGGATGLGGVLPNIVGDIIDGSIGLGGVTVLAM
jgi:hypothetical protein